MRLRCREGLGKSRSKLWVFIALSLTLPCWNWLHYSYRGRWRGRSLMQILNGFNWTPNMCGICFSIARQWLHSFFSFLRLNTAMFAHRLSKHEGTCQNNTISVCQVMTASNRLHVLSGSREEDRSKWRWIKERREKQEWCRRFSSDGDEGTPHAVAWPVHSWLGNRHVGCLKERWCFSNPFSPSCLSLTIRLM